MSIVNNPAAREDFMRRVFDKVDALPRSQPPTLVVTHEELHDLLNAVLDELDKDFC